MNLCATALLLLLSLSVGCANRAARPSFLSPQQHRRLKGKDGVVVPLTEFCSKTNKLETFLRDTLVNFFIVQGFSITYVDQEGFRCVCSEKIPGNETNSSPSTFALVCRARYLQESDDPGVTPPLVLVESMTLQAIDDTETYVPSAVSWQEFPSGASLEELDGYGGEDYTSGSVESGILLEESYTIAVDNATGALFLGTCSVDDEVGACPGAVCGICDGGITSFRDDLTCFSAACEEAQIPVGIFAYYQSEGLVVRDDFNLDNQQDEDCTEKGPNVEDYCANLDAVAQNFIDTYVKVVGPLDKVNVTRAYKCSCSDWPPLSVTCDLLYVGDNGDNYRNRDMVTYVTKGQYQVASTFQWCDTNLDFPAEAYCETFELGQLQQDFEACNINGCVTTFCSACQDGLSYAYTCGEEGKTCVDKFEGSFWQLHREDKLSIEKCTGAPTTAPTKSAAPTSLPETPTPQSNENTVAGITSERSAGSMIPSYKGGLVCAALALVVSFVAVCK